MSPMGLKLLQELICLYLKKEDFSMGLHPAVTLTGFSLKKRLLTGRSFFQTMNETQDLLINDQWIVSQPRASKILLIPRRPYAWLVEKERTVNGKIEDTAIIFLTNRECAFHCLMCDLWKNTTDITIPVGAIPDQIEWALERMQSAKHLKLYNSGSFFDGRAIPEEDYPRIASLVSHFETVIVESHPKLIGEKCLSFRDMLKPELHVALGLETVNPDLLLRLNKKMTLQDFTHSVSFLTYPWDTCKGIYAASSSFSYRSRRDLLG